MSPYRFYIQQLHFDGETYTKGAVIDTYEAYGVVCKDFKNPFASEPKQLVTRDWPGADGLDVYIPSTIRMKEFDTEAEFIISGDGSAADDDTETTDVLASMRQFILFMYGRNSGAVGARLAIYDEHLEAGYKDVVVKSVETDTAERQSGGNDAVVVLKVKFTVYDPVTSVTPSFSSGAVSELTW